MAEQALKLMTVDEFLVWDDGTDTRHELADGVTHAMSPPQGPHRTITSNANALMHNALRSRWPCRPEGEAGVRIDAHTMWQADVAVTCEPPAPAIADPMLILEVLSASTRNHDLARKLNDYKALESVREIWMADSERRWLQVWRRQGDGWVGQDLVGASAFSSDVLGMSVELDELYANSGF